MSSEKLKLSRRNILKAGLLSLYALTSKSHEIYSPTIKASTNKNANENKINEDLLLQKASYELQKNNMYTYEFSIAELKSLATQIANQELSKHKIINALLKDPKILISENQALAEADVCFSQPIETTIHAFLAFHNDSYGQIYIDEFKMETAANENVFKKAIINKILDKLQIEKQAEIILHNPNDFILSYLEEKLQNYDIKPKAVKFTCTKKHTLQINIISSVTEQLAHEEKKHQ